jgi:hypothetical protein
VGDCTLFLGPCSCLGLQCCRVGLASEHPIDPLVKMLFCVRTSCLLACRLLPCASEHVESCVHKLSAQQRWYKLPVTTGNCCQLVGYQDVPVPAFQRRCCACCCSCAPRHIGTLSSTCKDLGIAWMYGWMYE